MIFTLSIFITIMSVRAVHECVCTFTWRLLANEMASSMYDMRYKYMHVKLTTLILIKRTELFVYLYMCMLSTWLEVNKNTCWINEQSNENKNKINTQPSNWTNWNKQDALSNLKLTRRQHLYDIQMFYTILTRLDKLTTLRLSFENTVITIIINYYNTFVCIFAVRIFMIQPYSNVHYPSLSDILFWTKLTHFWHNITDSLSSTVRWLWRYWLPMAGMW